MKNGSNVICDQISKSGSRSASYFGGSFSSRKCLKGMAQWIFRQGAKHLTMFKRQGCGFQRAGQFILKAGRIFGGKKTAGRSALPF